MPASWCGLYGYKASFGRVPFVSRPNAFGAGNIFLFEGTLTRNVEDAAIGLNALSGYHPRDPFSLDTDYDFSRALGRSIKGWKIAYSPNFDVFPVDQEVKNVITNSAKAFEDMGAHVEKVDLGINRSQQELSDSKLPVGMQIIGKRYADEDVLAASSAFERIKPWHDIYNLIQKETV
ncbi:amidase family protein [Lentibacillus juripiscarius]|uniref:Amidase family protein n=1 Tax=Lentibacillus juripiscarius TaxID=257446 RepID=A0ABW5V4V4_9BACI